LSLEGKVVFTGFIDEWDKPFLIAGSKMFVYPSIYEGFGIPVLEALACGVPTITSNVSSLPEVAGEAALLIDPEDSKGLYQSMKRLCVDQELRRQLRRSSVEQADKFSWDNTAMETINTYNSIRV